MATLATVRSSIAMIDSQIDANRVELCRRMKAKPRGSAGWQAAWDKHPDLWARERSLFARRGELQLDRSELQRAAASKLAPYRFAPRKKCPTCGAVTFAKAA